VVSDGHRRRLFSGKNGVFPGTVLADGFVAGTWELLGRGESTSMLVRPYVALRGRVLDDVVAEGNRLLERAFEVADPQVAITE
jgi:hypothetical protein